MVEMVVKMFNDNLIWQLKKNTPQKINKTTKSYKNQKKIRNNKEDQNQSYLVLYRRRKQLIKKTLKKITKNKSKKLEWKNVIGPRNEGRQTILWLILDKIDNLYLVKLLRFLIYKHM